MNADAQTNTEPMDDDVIEQNDVESQDDVASSEDVVEPMSPEMIEAHLASETCSAESQRCIEQLITEVIAATEARQRALADFKNFQRRASEEEQRMLSFVGQIGILVNNCQMFRAARVEQDKIQSRIALLEQLKSIGSELDSSDKMVHQIIERTREVLNCDKGRLFMKDPKRNVLWSTDGGIASETSLSDGQGSIQGWVARNDQIVRIVDAYADPRFCSAEDVRTQYHTHSVIAVPMHNSQQELTGVIMMVVSAATVGLGCGCCRL